MGFSKWVSSLYDEQLNCNYQFKNWNLFLEWKTKTQISTFDNLDLKLDSWSQVYVELELEPF
jgi:hypothetical protein